MTRPQVMYHRRTEQEALMDAIEMAVLSTVSHPHVVRAYACFTDMVEVTDAPQPGAPRGEARCDRAA